MAVYRFRVSFEEFDEVHRDIEIKSIQTFEQFHYAIQEAIGFDASKPASFFMSNDNWKKGQEITSLPNAKNAEGSQARLAGRQGFRGGGRLRQRTQWQDA